MPNLNRIIFVAAFLAALALAFFAGRGWKPKQSGNSEQLPEQQQARSVQNQKAKQTADSLGRVKYQATVAPLLSRIKALQADSILRASKDKQATGKAQQSAQEFAKKPTIENCSVALTDCQEENQTKAAVIANRDSTIQAQRDLDKTRVSEIDRQNTALDSAFTGWAKSDKGWQEANVNGAKWERKAKRRFGVGPNITGTLLNGKPAGVIGIGIQYNLIKF